MRISPETDFSSFELDEIYWFTKERKSHKNGVNKYIMTMISRSPHQIVGFNVDKSVNAKAIQEIVDSVWDAEQYYTDGCLTYLDVVFGGKHMRNPCNKKDTHTIESTNSDLRHYIKGLSHRNRCFFRSNETLKAVLSVFTNAYNKYGEVKLKYRKPVIHKSQNPSKHLHKYQDVQFSILDFL